MFSFMSACQSFCPQGDFFATPPSVQGSSSSPPSAHSTSPRSVQDSTPTYQVPPHWTRSNLFKLDLTVQGPSCHQTCSNLCKMDRTVKGPTDRSKVFNLDPTSQGPLPQTCSNLFTL